MRGHLTILKKPDYASMAVPSIALGESVMRLREAIYRLNIALERKDGNSINVTRMNLCNEMETFKQISDSDEKNSLIARKLIFIGQENIKSAQENLDIAVLYLKSTLKSVG